MKITRNTGAIYFRDIKGKLVVDVAVPVQKGDKYAGYVAIVTAAVGARCCDRKWLYRQTRWFLSLRLSKATELGVSVRLRKRKAVKR